MSTETKRPTLHLDWEKFAGQQAERGAQANPMSQRTLDELAENHAQAKVAQEQMNRMHPEPRPRPRGGEMGRMADEVDAQVAKDVAAIRMEQEKEAYKQAQAQAARQAIDRQMKPGGWER